METTLVDQLEAMVDAHDLQTVLDALAEVCREKATHLRASWQDVQTARWWERAAKAIDRATEKAK